MICEDVRAKLTAYLDGELEGERGSAVRGHLRGCDACRGLAADEAALRDGLRSLPPLDPPHALWTGIQQRLAAEEVADSERPAWRRLVARLHVRWAPLAPQLALGSAALAVAVGVLAWRIHERGAPPPPAIAIAPVPPAPAPTVPPPLDGDVTAELAAEVDQTAATYQQAADELVQVASEDRAGWPDDRKQLFDARLAAFRRDVAAAPAGHAREKVYRSMIRYLQGVAIRDEVAANDKKLAGARGLP